MKKYYFLGIVSTTLMLIIYMFLTYLSLSIGGRESFLTEIYFLIIFGWFVVIPVFIAIVLFNSYLLRKIDIHLINISLYKRGFSLFIAGIGIALILGGVLFLGDDLLEYLHLNDDYYLYYVFYSIVGYVCGIGIRKLFGRGNWGSTTCNIERKGVTGRIIGALILTVTSLYFSSNYGIYEIPFLMIFVGFLLYESRNRWCIVRSFGKKAQLGEDSL